jgi:hypothetical protein
MLRDLVKLRQYSNLHQNEKEKQNFYIDILFQFFNLQNVNGVFNEVDFAAENNT